MKPLLLAWENFGLSGFSKMF